MPAGAQSAFTFTASQQLTSMKYSDSQQNALNSEYSGILTGGYNLGYRFVSGNGIMLQTGLGMRKAGATMVYDVMNYKWDLQYAELKLGGGYMMVKEKVSPYLNISGYFGYLLRGFQTINNEDFDIKSSGSIKTSDFGLYLTPGVQFTISETMSLFAEFNYLMGLKNLEVDTNQNSKNYAFGLSLGLSFSFSK